MFLTYLPADEFGNLPCGHVVVETEPDKDPNFLTALAPQKFVDAYQVVKVHGYPWVETEGPARYIPLIVI